MINELKLTKNLFPDNLCICDTKNTYYGWTNNISNPSLQLCLKECPENHGLDFIAYKCYELKSNIDETCKNYLYNCFSSEKTCKSEGYEIKGENKECFKSIEECLSNNYSYYYY